MLRFPPKIALAQTPTPLQPLRRLQKKIGGPLIWLKRDDLTGSTLTGNKVRKLEFIAAEAQAAGCDTLITCGGLQSNHCRATALLAAQLGWSCELILRGEPEAADGNLLLDQLAGATIHYCPVKDYSATLAARFDTRCRELAAEGRRAYCIPTGGSDAVGVWGYISAAKELRQDFQLHHIAPAAVISAAGSGGTLAGLIAGAKLFSLDLTVFGINVCDDAAYFEKKVGQDLLDWCRRYPQQSAGLSLVKEDICLIDGYVGAGYGQANDTVIETISLLAKTEGVVFDPVYTGKAFGGLLSEMADGRFSVESDIVFIHTGGVFGLYPHRALFSPLR